jgi:hypothetical protein
VALDQVLQHVHAAAAQAVPKQVLHALLIALPCGVADRR